MKNKCLIERSVLEDLLFSVYIILFRTLLSGICLIRNITALIQKQRIPTVKKIGLLCRIF